MYQCESQEVPCLDKSDYNTFDETCREELVNAITVDQIVNQSQFCTFLALDIIKASDKADALTLNEHLAGLNRKRGLYHLWIEIGNCQDHRMYSLQCVYVGKGNVKGRVLEHIKKKWPEQEMFYVTFFECENRIAVYLEQLFLGTYNFYLNENENTGTAPLFARWPEERMCHGTELETHAKILAGKDWLKDVAFDD